MFKFLHVSRQFGGLYPTTWTGGGDIMSRMTELEWEIVGRLGYAVSKNEFLDHLAQVVSQLKNNLSPSAYLLIAELCRKWALGQTAAQTYLRAIICCALRQSEQQPICEATGEALTFAMRSAPTFSSLMEIVAYAAAGIRKSLREDLFNDQETKLWFRQALQGLRTKEEAAFQACVTAFGSTSLLTEIGESFKEELWVFQHYLSPALNVRVLDLRSRRANVTFWLTSFLVGLGILGCAWYCTKFPLSSSLWLYSSEDALHVSLLLALWPGLLVLTWLFGRAVSIRKGVFHQVSPAYYLSNPTPIVFGEIMPFKRDRFFDIFQFVWVFYLPIAAVSFKTFQRLPQFLTRAWNPENSLGLTAQQYEANALPSIRDTTFHQLWLLADPSQLADALNGASTVGAALRVLLWNDGFALIAAAVVTTWFLWTQLRIQRRRITTGSNFYWWDWRVSRVEWLVRWVMVGFDAFLMTFILMKIAAIVSVVFELSVTDLVRVDYFNPDGAGGLEYLQTVLSWLFALVIVFGCFVMASLYLHRNLPEYRRSNFMLVLSYGTLAALMASPLVFMQDKIFSARELLYRSTEVASASHTDAVSNLQKIQALHDWHVSIISFNYLSTPFFLLLFQLFVQIGFVVWQSNKHQGNPNALTLGNELIA
jgi:hypothetical protein